MWYAKKLRQYGNMVCSLQPFLEPQQITHRNDRIVKKMIYYMKKLKCTFYDVSRYLGTTISSSNLTELLVRLEYAYKESVRI